MTERARLRVGINLCWVDPQRSGPAEHAILDVLRALAQEPPDDIELVLFGSTALQRAEPGLAEAFEVHAVPFPAGSRAVRVLVERTWLRGAVQRARLDVLHDAGGTSAGTLDIPRILSIHDLAPIERPRGMGWLRVAYHRRVVPRSVEQAAGVLVPSAFVRERLIDVMDVPNARIDVVPWPLPRHEEAAPIETIRARHGIIGQIILLPGSTRPDAEHLVAIRALRHLAARHKETTLVLFGEEGAAERQVQAEIRSLGLEERVVRLTSTSAAVRSALFEHAAVVVYPSVYGGFAHSVLEAMACGVPVVVADSGAAPELVEHVGGIIPPGDDAQLAVEIHRVLDDGAWRDRMVHDGLDRAREYTPRRAAEGLLLAYRSTVVSL